MNISFDSLINLSNPTTIPQKTASKEILQKEKTENVAQKIFYSIGAGLVTGVTVYISFSLLIIMDKMLDTRIPTKQLERIFKVLRVVLPIISIIKKYQSLSKNSSNTPPNNPSTYRINLSEKNEPLKKADPKISEEKLLQVPKEEVKKTEKSLEKTIDPKKMKERETEEIKKILNYIIANSILAYVTGKDPFYFIPKIVKENLFNLVPSTLNKAKEAYFSMKTWIYDINHTTIFDQKPYAHWEAEHRKNDPLGYLRDLYEKTKGLSDQDISQKYGCADILATWEINPEDTKEHKKIYREMSLKVHPDKSKHSDAEKFFAILTLVGKKINDDKKCSSILLETESEMLEKEVQKTLIIPSWLFSFFTNPTCSFDTEDQSWDVPLIHCKNFIDTLPEASQQWMNKLMLKNPGSL